MTRLRVRISTLMLCIIIVALAITLIAEKQRSARLIAESEANAKNQKLRALEAVEMYYKSIADAQLASQAANLAPKGSSIKPITDGPSQ